jgi:hypothetical protein
MGITLKKVHKPLVLAVDKAALTLDYSAKHEQDFIIDRAKLLLVSVPYTKHVGENSLYKHVLQIWSAPFGGARLFEVQYQPKHDARFVRLEWNPTQVDAEEVREWIETLLPGGTKDLATSKARATRIDYAVDVQRRLGDLLLSYPKMRVSRLFFNGADEQKRTLETLYIGSGKGAVRVVAYDKVAETLVFNGKHQNATKPIPPEPTTRIEVRLAPNIAPLLLLEGKNPFSSLQVWERPQEAANEPLWDLFRGACEAYGAQTALAMVPTEGARKRVKAILKTPTWWSPKHVTAQLASAINHALILDQNIPPAPPTPVVADLPLMPVQEASI